MSLIYITGPTGSGKSTLSIKLRDLGCETYDADEKICAWYENATGKQVGYPKDPNVRPADWQLHHSFLMSETIVKELYIKSKSADIFILGIAPNDLEIAEKYFDKVILLVISETTMVNRVRSRTNNQYGKSSDQLKIITDWFKPTLEKYRNYGAIEINAELLEEEVIGQILRVTKDTHHE